MSLANLLVPNSYDLFSDSLITDTLITTSLTTTNITTNNLTANNITTTNLTTSNSQIISHSLIAHLDSTGVVTASMMQGGVVVSNPGGISMTATFDSAANVVASFSNPQVGDTITYLHNNIDPSGGGVNFAGPGAGVDVTNLNAFIGQGNSITTNNASVVRFYIQLTNVTVGSEAYLIYC
ncbi:MAG TPA: hypothetical protein VKR58_01075 [Aquella sp.]|nr:hypothetical protein [Aquella sp.]